MKQFSLQKRVSKFRPKGGISQLSRLNSFQLYLTLPSPLCRTRGACRFVRASLRLWTFFRAPLRLRRFVGGALCLWRFVGGALCLRRFVGGALCLRSGPSRPNTSERIDNLVQIEQTLLVFNFYLFHSCILHRSTIENQLFKYHQTGLSILLLVLMIRYKV
jgi:hypothetical protein